MTTAEAPIAARGETNGSRRLRMPLPMSISDEELIAINDENPGWRIERSDECVLEARMTASKLHTRTAAELSGQMYMWYRLNDRIGVLCDSDGTYNLDDGQGTKRTWAPDVSWISQERYDARTSADRQGRGFWNLAPDFVIEVSSPDDSREDTHLRMAQWLRFGVRLAWSVDPWNGTVAVFRPEHEPELLQRPERVGGEDVLVGLEVDFSEIWQWADGTQDE